ncbi:MAG: 3-isopropylmalate dehydrogenase [Candidatus Methanoliparum thermophilum]|uniref:3-isopropylmalate dehydrogenase n=1 Tax=Methanoliparum thermophilum TaxID=2491083 RepID=A0A520KS59_METT2|nr:isocitrate/isopropylmalate family dehydrogenase [Candidatus Methanoliparum sp. LAM-1]RZN64620.1 MAG: 3-isopropylmalate dehydrogenase [Candidatus Methanoliparum thermophilum]BDC35756.1 3-isopropylmalate dehydrogenase [Candidatus Methanoliparum sp. LAM-1]
MSSYKIPVIPGDGIGPEVITEGKKVMEAAAELFQFDISWIDFDIGAERYIKTGKLIEEEELKELSRYKAIYLGAVGDPKVKPGILEKGILLKIRFYFDQYINLRPIKLLKGVETPIKNKKPEDINFLVIRENTEDFYVGIGGRVERGKSKQELELARDLYSIKFGLDIEHDADEIAYQIGVISKEGARRVIEYAFERSMERRKNLSSVDKANVLSDIYGFWRDVFGEVSKGYPDVETSFYFVDAITMWFVKNPEWFDVIVTPNMFGDIITDLGAMIQGGMGLAPGGNINPSGTSMFEPIHGSAPKYKGKNVSNPIATIWAGSMILETLGEKKAAKTILDAIEENLSQRVALTRDLGGDSTTKEVGDAIVRMMKNIEQK